MGVVHGVPGKHKLSGERSSDGAHEKTGFKPVFDSSAVRCDVVTHRGIEPRSTPSESATLSVELMGHIEYWHAGARKGTGII